MPPPHLLNHPLFQGTDEKRYAHLLPHIPVYKASSRTLINRPDAPSSLFHLVLRGQLRTYILSRGGRHLVFELIDAGGFDGILPVTGHHGHYTEVTREALLASIEWRTLLKLASADPGILPNLLDLIAMRLSRREEHLETIALHDPSARLARQLIALAEGFGDAHGAWTVLQPRLTHQLLADMLGLRRETVTLHLRSLTDLGAIRLAEGHYWLNRDALARLAAAGESSLPAGSDQPALARCAAGDE